MDGTLAIEANRAALKRIVEGLVEMAGFAEPTTSPLMGEVATKSREGVNDREVTPTRRPDVRRPPHKGEVEPRTIPRLLWCAILKFLRPAESAARRLVIAAARGLVVPPPPVRKSEPKPEPIDPLLRRFGIAVVVGPGGAARNGTSSPAKRGRGTAEGGGGGAPRRLTLALFDPPRHLGPPRTRFVAAHFAPRIFIPGVTEPARLPPRPSPDDWVSVEGLTRRLAALIAALDDLPGQARRYVRLSARRLAGTHRWPIRRVCPPGGRLFRYDPAATHPKNIRAVDEILAHAHALAVYALECPDTS